ncbi:MAG: BppU family phage baseplate upper protein, partial [Clostridium sp.]
MQNNVISKIYNFTLDTKKIKPLLIKDKLLTTSDSAIWNITIEEDGIAKDISNCSVRLLVNKPNDEITCEQKDNIVITGINTISIQPKDTMISTSGINSFVLVISDLNEEIVTQGFAFNITKSSATNIVESAKEELNTLDELSRLIGKSYADLQFIKERVNELGIEVNEDTQAIYQNVANVDKQVRLLENRIVNANNTIDKLPNRIILQPIEIAGSNYYYFESPYV